MSMVLNICSSIDKISFFLINEVKGMLDSAPFVSMATVLKRNLGFFGV